MSYHAIPELEVSIYHYFFILSIDNEFQVLCMGLLRLNSFSSWDGNSRMTMNSTKTAESAQSLAWHKQQRSSEKSRTRDWPVSKGKTEKHTQGTASCPWVSSFLGMVLTSCSWVLWEVFHLSWKSPSDGFFCKIIYLKNTVSILNLVGLTGCFYLNIISKWHWLKKTKHKFESLLVFIILIIFRLWFT